MEQIAEFLQKNPIVLIVSLIASLIAIFSKDGKEFFKHVLGFKVPVWVVLLMSILFIIILKPREVGVSNKPLKAIQGKSFGVQQVYLDGYRFERCKFNGSELIFSGKAKTELIENSFLNPPKITLTENAALTLNFLTKMNSDPAFRQIIDATIINLKKGNMPASTPIGKQE